MNFNGKLGNLAYGVALVASLTGALMLLTGFILAADWNYGVHALMVAYLAFSLSGTLGLLVAVLTFWSQRPLFNKIGLFSNLETLIFATTLAIGFLFDKHRDYSPMIVGVSRFMSISISSVAWFVTPVGTSAIGTTVSLLRTKALRRSEVTPWQQ